MDETLTIHRRKSFIKLTAFIMAAVMCLTELPAAAFRAFAADSSPDRAYNADVEFNEGDLFYLGQTVTPLPDRGYEYEYGTVDAYGYITEDATNNTKVGVEVLDSGPHNILDNRLVPESDTKSIGTISKEDAFAKSMAAKVEYALTGTLERGYTKDPFDYQSLPAPYSTGSFNTESVVGPDFHYLTQEVVKSENQLEEDDIALYKQNLVDGNIGDRGIKDMIIRIVDWVQWRPQDSHVPPRPGPPMTEGNLAYRELWDGKIDFLEPYKFIPVLGNYEAHGRKWMRIGEFRELAANFYGSNEVTLFEFWNRFTNIDPRYINAQMEDPYPLLDEYYTFVIRTRNKRSLSRDLNLYKLPYDFGSLINMLEDDILVGDYILLDMIDYYKSIAKLTINHMYYQALVPEAERDLEFLSTLREDYKDRDLKIEYAKKILEDAEYHKKKYEEALSTFERNMDEYESRYKKGKYLNGKGDRYKGAKFIFNQTETFFESMLREYARIHGGEKFGPYQSIFYSTTSRVVDPVAYGAIVDFMYTVCYEHRWYAAMDEIYNVDRQLKSLALELTDPVTNDTVSRLMPLSLIFYGGNKISKEEFIDPTNFEVTNSEAPYMNSGGWYNIPLVVLRRKKGFNPFIRNFEYLDEYAEIENELQKLRSAGATLFTMNQVYEYLNNMVSESYTYYPEQYFPMIKKSVQNAVSAREIQIYYEILDAHRIPHSRIADVEFEHLRGDGIQKLIVEKQLMSLGLTKYQIWPGNSYPTLGRDLADMQKQYADLVLEREEKMSLYRIGYGTYHGSYLEPEYVYKMSMEELHNYIRKSMEEYQSWNAHYRSDNVYDGNYLTFNLSNVIAKRRITDMPAFPGDIKFDEANSTHLNSIFRFTYVDGDFPTSTYSRLGGLYYGPGGIATNSTVNLDREYDIYGNLSKQNLGNVVWTSVANNNYPFLIAYKIVDSNNKLVGFGETPYLTINVTGDYDTGTVTSFVLDNGEETQFLNIDYALVDLQGNPLEPGEYTIYTWLEEELSRYNLASRPHVFNLQLNEPEERQAARTPFDKGSKILFGYSKKYLGYEISEPMEKATNAITLRLPVAENLTAAINFDYTNTLYETQGGPVYSEPEPLLWTAMGDEDAGVDATYVADSVVNIMSYGDDMESTWENSFVRLYLNRDFSAESFSEIELKSLITTENVEYAADGQIMSVSDNFYIPSAKENMVELSAMEQRIGMIGSEIAGHIKSFAAAKFSSPKESLGRIPALSSSTSDRLILSLPRYWVRSPLDTVTDAYIADHNGTVTKGRPTETQGSLEYQVSDSKLSQTLKSSIEGADVRPFTANEMFNIVSSVIKGTMNLHSEAAIVPPVGVRPVTKIDPKSVVYYEEVSPAVFKLTLINPDLGTVSLDPPVYDEDGVEISPPVYESVVGEKAIITSPLVHLRGEAVDENTEFFIGYRVEDLETDEVLLAGYVPGGKNPMLDTESLPLGNYRVRIWVEEHFENHSNEAGPMNTLILAVVNEFTPREVIYSLNNAPHNDGTTPTESMKRTGFQFLAANAPTDATPPSPGKTFRFWSPGYNLQFAKERYLPGQTITMPAGKYPFRLNAIWGGQYTITLASDIGLESEGYTEQVWDGDEFIFPDAEDIGIKPSLGENYIFLGWTRDPRAGNIHTYSPGDKYEMPDSNVTYYARWLKNFTELNFIVNNEATETYRELIGETFYMPDIEEVVNELVSVEAGTPVDGYFADVLEELGSPLLTASEMGELAGNDAAKESTDTETVYTPVGLRFVGWRLGYEDNQEPYYPGDEIIVDEMVLYNFYPVWEALPEVRYVIDGSTYGYGYPGEDGSSTVLTMDQVLEGYNQWRDMSEFKGWSREPNSKVVHYKPGSTINVPNTGITLHAVFNTNVTVLFFINGNETKREEMNAGSIFSLPSLYSVAPESSFARNEMALRGYTLNFEGWTDEPNGTYPKYSPGNVTIIEEDRNFYPVISWSVPTSSSGSTPGSVPPVIPATMHQIIYNDGDASNAKPPYWAAEGSNFTVHDAGELYPDYNCVDYKAEYEQHAGNHSYYWNYEENGKSGYRRAGETVRIRTDDYYFTLECYSEGDDIEVKYVLIHNEQEYAMEAVTRNKNLRTGAPQVEVFDALAIYNEISNITNLKWYANSKAAESGIELLDEGSFYNALCSNPNVTTDENGKYVIYVYTQE